MQQPPPLPSSGVLQQIFGVAYRVPDTGNQKIAVGHHILIGPDDGCPLGTISIPEDRTSGQTSLAVPLDDRRDGTARTEKAQFLDASLASKKSASAQPFKSSIPTHHKIGDSILSDELLYRLCKRSLEGIRTYPVSNKEASFPHADSLLRY